MIASEIAPLRLCNQQIAGTDFTMPGEVVSWLGAMQAQDYAGAKWSIGLRLPAATDETIEEAIANKTIIRTWPMRGTLHFVAAEDVRWLLDLLAPRIVAQNARRYGQLDLDEAIFSRSYKALVKAMQGGQQLTREEAYEALEQAGISTAGQRGYGILQRAGMDRLICFGVRRDKQPTFVLLDEWLPVSKILAREEALGEVAQRYFTGHGPATVADFMWWTGLPAAEARAGLDMAKPLLISETIEGQTYWLSPHQPTTMPDPATGYLLPGFDEYLLGYKDRSAVLEAQYVPYIWPGGGMFSPTVVIDGRVVGAWKRTLKKDKVVVTISPFTSLSEAQSQALSAAVKPYSRFVGMMPAVHLKEPPA
jgi:hypothetical protein